MVFFIDKTLYSREAITATVYRFSGDYNISVESSSEDKDKYIIAIERVNKEELDDEIKDAFLKDLTDQQVRLDIEARFGHIRDLIVEEAFKPVMKR